MPAPKGLFFVVLRGHFSRLLSNRAANTVPSSSPWHRVWLSRRMRWANSLGLLPVYWVTTSRSHWSSRPHKMPSVTMTIQSPGSPRNLWTSGRAARPVTMPAGSDAPTAHFTCPPRRM